MTLTYAEAARKITAPGEPFETTQMSTGGVTSTVFVNVPATLRDVFDTARGRGDDTFLVYEDERWSFERVMAEVDACAAALVGRYGVKKGDRVAIGMRNFPEWIVSWAATLSVGAVAVSLNAWWTADEIDYALRDSSPKVLVADVERVARAVVTCRREAIAVVAVRPDQTTPDGNGVDRWSDVVVAGATPPRIDLSADDDATILYTSGTTGNPKGAVSTHRAIIQALWGFFARTVLDRTRAASAASAAETGSLQNKGFGGDESITTNGDGASAKSIADATAEGLSDALAQKGGRAVFILVVPLFHVTGCVPVMLSCFANGLKLVMMRKWDPERALELIERERVTAFVGVPTQSWDLLQSPRFAEFDTSSLVGVGGGGAPAPTDLVKRVAGSFANASPTIGYGMTETNAYGPQNNGADYLTHPTSTGRATPILQIEARDDSGATLPVGEVGELWMQGPNLIRGYWHNAEATAETIVNGWLRTGDIGHLDEEGFVYISDRAKDVVLRAGENVYCAEIENVLFEHPAVHEVAVFGVPDERLGEDVAAAVYLEPGGQASVEELQAFVAARLAPFKVPGQVMLVAEPLPRNAAGKFLKRELRDRLTV